LYIAEKKGNDRKWENRVTGVFFKEKRFLLVLGIFVGFWDFSSNFRLVYQVG